MHAAGRRPKCLYLLGGRTLSPADAGLEVYVLDTKLRAWSTALVSGDAPSARFDHVAAMVHGGQLVVFGGSSYTSYCSADTYALQLVWRAPLTEQVRPSVERFTPPSLLCVPP